MRGHQDMDCFGKIKPEANVKGKIQTEKLKLPRKH